MSMPKGYSAQLKEDRLSAEFGTMEPIRLQQYGQSMLAHLYTFQVGTDAAEAFSSNIAIVATAHAAHRGDVIRFTSGVNSGIEVKVYSITTMLITLCEKLPAAVGIGDTFSILRHIYPVIGSDGTITVTTTSGPISFTRDGVTTVVTEDTVTPANNRPLPVRLESLTGPINITANDLNVSLRHNGADPSSIQIGDGTTIWSMTLGGEGKVSDATTHTTLTTISGQLPTTLGQKTSANSLAVVVASDQSAIPVSQSGTWNINNISGTVSLPTGASTLAAQTTGNASLASIDGKLPTTLGQKTAANSLAVVLASDQTAIPISSEPATAASGGALPSTLKIIGGYSTGSGSVRPIAVDDNGFVKTLTYDSAGSSITNGQKTMANSSPVTIASDQSALPVSQSGTWNINNVSGTISLPTGAATSALQTTGNTTLSTISGQLPATLGQKAMAASLAVVIASDQSAVPVSQSGTWNINNVSGTISLPTGAATSALQTTGNTTLTTISGQLPTTLGQKTMANSLAVVISSDQSAVPVSQSGTWNINNVSGTISLPTGAATSALQTTGNTSLSSIDGKLNSLGQKTMANSMPVVLASDQTSIPITTTGRSSVTTVRNDYTSTNVTSGAWVQLVASLGSIVNELDIFDSSGQTLELGTGAAASEVRQILIYPGGNGRVNLKIASGTRVSIRAVSATASVGELDINFLG